MYKISCVLLVEDDPISKFIAMRAIKSTNFVQEIQTFNNGQEALNFLINKAESRELAPELIFFDINMPIIDGYEFYKKVQHLPFTNKGRIAFCVLTNSNHPDDLKKFQDLNIHEYLIKPLTKNAIELIYEKYFGTGNQVQH